MDVNKIDLSESRSKAIMTSICEFLGLTIIEYQMSSKFKIRWSTKPMSTYMVCGKDEKAISVILNNTQTVLASKRYSNLLGLFLNSTKYLVQSDNIWRKNPFYTKQNLTKLCIELTLLGYEPKNLFSKSLPK